MSQSSKHVRLDRDFIQETYPVVLGEPLGAARCACLELARIDPHGEVGKVVVLEYIQIRA